MQLSRLFALERQPNRHSQGHSTYRPRLEALEARSLPSLTYTPIDFHAQQNLRIQGLQPEMQTCPEGDVTLGGIPFSIPAGGNNAWLGSGPSTFTIDVGVTGVTEVQTLINTIYGWAGTHAALEFFGSAGAYYRKDLVSNSDIRDHYNALWTNQINNTTTTNVFSNGPARLDKQQIDLPGEFAGQTLQTIRVIDDGNNNYGGTPIDTWQNVIFYGVTVGTSSFDVTPTSLGWNSLQGGVDFTYQVTGADLTQNVPVALYWASGSSFADRLGKIPGTDSIIPSGTRVSGSPYASHVNGDLLKSAPLGATDLLVVVGDPAGSGFDPVADVKALADVQVTYGGTPVARPVLSDYTIGVIKDALRYAGQPVGVVTSTYRTPREQAAEMYRNILATSPQQQKKLYGPSGDKVIQAYQDALKAYNLAKKKDPNTPTPDYVSIMEGKIVEVGPENVSKHCGDFSVLQAVDISFSQITNQQLFHDALALDLRIAKLLDPFTKPHTDPAFHIEVPQI
jgi:hypothetical protein